MTPVQALIGTEGSIQWKLDRNTQVLTLSGEGAMPDYDPYGGSIPGWVNLRNLIREVHFEEGITHIGEYAFFPFDYGELAQFPPRIVRVVFPKSLRSIGFAAFRGNIGLEKLDLRNLKNLESIAPFAFASCFHAKSLDLSGCEKLASIGMHAFASCDEMSYVNVACCRSLSKKSLIMLRHDLPRHVPILNAPHETQDAEDEEGANTSDNDPVLSGQRHPEQIGIFGTGVNSSLIYTLQEGTLHITGSGPIPPYDACDVHRTAPWQSDSMIEGIPFHALVERVVLSDGITTIGARSFSNLPYLKHVIFPPSLTYVGEGAFSCCRSLEKVDFSKCYRLRFIGKEAFALCPHLTNIQFPTGPLPTKKGILYVPSNTFCPPQDGKTLSGEAGDRNAG